MKGSQLGDTAMFDLDGAVPVKLLDVAIGGEAQWVPVPLMAGVVVVVVVVVVEERLRLVSHDDGGQQVVAMMTMMIRDRAWKNGIAI